MAEKWEQLRDALLSSVETRAKDFLDTNKPARDFLVERAGRLAKLSVEWVAATTDEQKKLLRQDMTVVQQTMENQITALAVNASADGRRLLAGIVGTAFETVIKALPTIIGML